MKYFAYSLCVASRESQWTLASWAIQTLFWLEWPNIIGVARATISRILNGGKAVTMDLSIRLGEAFSLSPDFFSKAQLQRDLLEASQRKRRKIKPLAA